VGVEETKDSKNDWTCGSVEDHSDEGKSELQRFPQRKGGGKINRKKLSRKMGDSKTSKKVRSVRSQKFEKETLKKKVIRDVKRTERHWLFFRESNLKRRWASGDAGGKATRERHEKGDPSR